MSRYELNELGGGPVDEVGWRWRDWRAINFEFGFSPFQWEFIRFEKEADALGYDLTLLIGPFLLMLSFQPSTAALMSRYDLDMQHPD